MLVWITHITLQKVEPILDAFFDAETLSFLLQNNPSKNKDSLISSLILIFDATSESVRSSSARKHPSFPRTALKAIKAGIVLFESTGDAENLIKPRLFALMTRFVRSQHAFNYRRDTMQLFTAEL